MLLPGLLLLSALLLLYGPSLWAKQILKRHSAERPDIPHSGQLFARQLLDQQGLSSVSVEEADKLGDHYDPIAKAVRLSPGHFQGHSLAAITVAAHEVGHALQDQANYPPMRLRGRLVQLAQPLEKISRVILPVAPIAMLLTRSPIVGLGLLLTGLGTLLLATLLHLVTLPVEFDASFRRALPLLRKSQYLPPSDRPAARNILWACALTYLAQPAMSLLQLLRWLRPGPKL